MKSLIKLFKYIEPIWLGSDGKMSLRAVLAIAFSISFIRQTSYAVYKWSEGRSMESLSLVMGIAAGLIVALLGLTTYQNMAAQKMDSLAANPQAPGITIEKVETVTTGSTTTQAKVVNADKVNTVNSQNTNINSQIDNPDK